MAELFKPTNHGQVSTGFHEKGEHGFALNAIVRGEYKLFPAEVTLDVNGAGSVTFNPDAGIKDPKGVRSLLVRATGACYIAKTAAGLANAADGKGGGNSRVYIPADWGYLELPWWWDEVHISGMAGVIVYLIGEV